MNAILVGAAALLALLFLRKGSSAQHVVTPADIAINKATGIEIPLRSTRVAVPGGAFAGIEGATAAPTYPKYDIEAAVTLANPEPVGPVTILSVVQPDGTHEQASGTITPQSSDQLSYAHDRRGTISYTAPISFGPVAWDIFKTGDLIIRGGVSYVCQKGVNS